MRRMEVGAALLVVVVLTGQLSDGKNANTLEEPLPLQCPPCDRIQCTPRRAKRLDCAGGITTGVCNCCPVCAKIKGESCGGTYHAFGKCDAGLWCEPHNPVHKTDDLPWKIPPVDTPEGICKKAPLDKYAMDQPRYNRHVYCKPKCTPEFCRAHRKAICSAVDVAEKRQSCQGDCQHTACSACRFVTPSKPQCVKCRTDDFRCMRQFAKCVKAEVCARDTFPCRRNDKEASLGSKFQCRIPGCLP